MKKNDICPAHYIPMNECICGKKSDYPHNYYFGLSTVDYKFLMILLDKLLAYMSDPELIKRLVKLQETIRNQE